MINSNKLLIAILALALTIPVSGQTISKDLMVFYTSQWEGERFADGRPKVPDDILERMENVSIEEAWGVLRGAGYHNQFEGGWKMLYADKAIVGRALTALYMPNRPDVSDAINAKGQDDGRIGSPNSWPIDMLSTGDVWSTQLTASLQAPAQ